jgi:hypothetical protein
MRSASPAFILTISEYRGRSTTSPSRSPRSVGGAAGHQASHPSGDESLAIEPEVENRDLDRLVVEARADAVLSRSALAGQDEGVENRHLGIGQDVLHEGAPLVETDPLALISPSDHVPDDVVDARSTRRGGREAGVQVGEVEHAARVGQPVGHEVREEDLLRLPGAEVAAYVRVALPGLEVDRLEEGVLADQSGSEGKHQ